MFPAGRKLQLISPAKINLSLAILGKQADGFHALSSVVAQTQFGDHLQVEWNPDSSDQDRVTFCNADLDEEENTLTHALQEFRQLADLHEGQFILKLEKRIPIGAGLGGGSSNAVTVLKAIQEIFGKQVSGLDWHAMAARIGSDCPLFLADTPVLMEGRGERITPLETSLASRLRGKPVILFKPGFSINTAEAYSRLARKKFYQPAEKSLALMENWCNGIEILPPRCNDFERLLEDWMPSLSVILERLQRVYGLDARLSGSGSACFIFPNDPVFAIRILQDELAGAWGSSFWMQETCVN